MAKHLTTVEQVITELGGPAEFYKLVQREKRSSNFNHASALAALWKHRRRFPAHTFRIVNKALQARDCSASHKLWGMS